MSERGATRVRDFGCGELYTLASAGYASLHRYVRAPAHPHRTVEHAYPSHSLVFTDVGEWHYHGCDKPSTIDDEVVVTGVGQQYYSCSHPRGVSNECFIVAIADEAFEGDASSLFPDATVRLSPEMRAHRRAIAQAILHGHDPEQLESLAFSLYEIASRASSRTTRVPASDIRMAYAKKLIHDRCADRVSIADIARELNLSRFTLTRRFLSAVGVTPQQFMMEIRIDRAKKALTHTNRSIADVGSANGFGSIAHFSHAFRSVVGCTPTSYRLMTSSSAVSNAEG